MRSFSLFALAGLSVSFLLTGCGFGSEAVDTGVVVNGISGRMMGGQAPVTGATLNLYTFGTGGYGLAGSQLATTTTDNFGNYYFNAFTCPQNNTPVYLIGSGGNTGGGVNTSAVLGVTLGPCGGLNSLPGPIVFNEVTTAAMAFALAHYFNEIDGGYTQGADFFGGPSTYSGGIYTYSQGIINATTITLPQIVNNQIGIANSNVNGSPNSVVEAAKIYTIANIIGACVNTTGPTSNTETTSVCGQLFGYTKDYSNVRPSDTLQAAVQMALYPAANVKNLYNLIPPIGFAFGGYLTSVPQDFSIGVSYTTSNASLAVPTNAIATLDIDASGNVWFPSNGSGQVGLMQFYSAGSTAFNGPYNSSGLVNPTQVAIDNAGYAWLSDTGSSVVSGYNVNTPASVKSFTLPSTTTTAVTINDDNSVVVGLLSGSTPMLGSINTARTTYTALSNSALNYAAVSVAGDAVGGDGVSTTNTSTGAGASLYYYGPNANPSINFHSFPVATDAGLAGQTIFQGADFVALNTGQTSASDDLCVFSVQACFPIYPQAQRPTNVVIDGTAALWTSAPAGPGLLQIPQYSTYAPGGTSYLDTNYTPSRAEANELFHGTNNGATMVNPAAIAVDFAGNVWVANAGCTTTGCTPTQFVLSEVIGAAAPTITPVSVNIVNPAGPPTTGTEPKY
jgi:hypothetical protein